MIKWRFVIHGGIDGFSRTVTYLKCSTNNRANTVLNNFLASIQEYRCPLRIRSDYGTENVRVAEWMLEHHGADSKPFITGKSVHNQRIERLWLDIKVNVIIFCSDLFKEFESEGILDVDNEKHLFALHFVYLPRINKLLQQFKASWNNHPLRTARNMSPIRLWTEGFYRSLEEGILEATAIEIDDEYGIDFDGPIPEIETENNVQVPPVSFELTAEQETYLVNHFDPMERDAEYGKNTLINVIAYLDTLE